MFMIKFNHEKWCRQALSGKKEFFPAWKKRIADYLKVDISELFEEN